MSADDPFAAAQAEASTKKCPIARIEGVLEEAGDTENLEALRAALAKPREEVFGTVIKTVLANWGFDVTAEAVQRHRRGACRCNA